MMKAPKSQVIANKKKELYQKSTEYKSALTSDVNRLKVDLERIGKNVLFIGGSLYLAYKLAKLIGGASSEPQVEERKEKRSSQSLVKAVESSPIASKIKEQIALFLLAMALKKLKEFVKEYSNKNDVEG